MGEAFCIQSKPELSCSSHWDMLQLLMMNNSRVLIFSFSAERWYEDLFTCVTATGDGITSFHQHSRWILESVWFQNSQLCFCLQFCGYPLQLFSSRTGFVLLQAGTSFNKISKVTLFGTITSTYHLKFITGIDCLVILSPTPSAVHNECTYMPRKER